MLRLDLTGKVAIVTGGSQGIGKAIVETFIDCGAKVVIADINPEKAKDLANKFNDRALAVKVNVVNKEDTEKMVRDTVNAFGRVDILVNNAGISTMDFAVDIREEDWDRVMDVNAKGVYLSSQAVAKEMLKQGEGGKIINMASQAGKNGYRCMGNYCASKHAVIGFTKVMAVELAKDQINVNAVCPGIVETDMKKRERVEGGVLRGLSAEDIEAEDNSQVPLGRTAKPRDIANLVTFLASELSNYMTGQAINITGGMTMH